MQKGFASSSTRLLTISVKAIFICVSALVAGAQSSTDTTRAGFANPPDSAKPEVWWHWMSGNVSKDGAELDLAWMKRVGIGGVHIFSGGSLGEPTVVSPPVPFMSDTWKSIFTDSLSIARANSMNVTIAGSPGWSETGGTWVTPEQAMKKYVWSETQVDGGVPFRSKVRTPPSTTGPFQNLKSLEALPSDLTHDVYADALVVAFPTPVSEVSSMAATYTASSSDVDFSRLFGEGFDRPISLAPLEAVEGARAWIQVDFGKATSCSAITLGLASRAMLEIESSDDGATFHAILTIPADPTETPSPEQTISFPSVRARFIRIVFTPTVVPAPIGLPTPKVPKNVRLTRIAFHRSARMDHFESKAGFAPVVTSCQGRSKTRPVERSKSRPVVGSAVVGLIRGRRGSGA